MPDFEVIDKSTVDRAVSAFDGIRRAIEDKNVTVGNAPVEDYADKIRAISGGSTLPDGERIAIPPEIKGMPDVIINVGGGDVSSVAIDYDNREFIVGDDSVVGFGFYIGDILYTAGKSPEGWMWVIRIEAPYTPEPTNIRPSAVMYGGGGFVIFDISVTSFTFDVGDKSYIATIPENGWAITEVTSGEAPSPSISEKDINFYDYDGTLVQSYTVDEFASVTELPTPPAHSGLVFQRWNWSLSKIKATGRAVDVGAMYVTESGKSEFDLTLTPVTGLDVTLRIQNVTAGNMVTVDWGDGTSEDATTTTAGTKTFTHTYGALGQYTATVDGTGDYCPFGSASGAYNMFNVSPSYICTAVRLGARCSSINSYAFRNCCNLSSITLPDNVTSIGTIAFSACYGLTSITIPDSVTSINANTFSTCSSLASVILPEGVTSIGTNALSNCYILTSLMIPDSVTNISNPFANCYNVRKYTMLPNIPPALDNVSAFSGINAFCVIEVPMGSLEAYQTATNWSTYAAYMREAE